MIDRESFEAGDHSSLPAAPFLADTPELEAEGSPLEAFEAAASGADDADRVTALALDLTVATLERHGNQLSSAHRQALRYAVELFTRLPCKAEGIFAGLADGRWDAVASGATVTDRRREQATFCRPYVRSGQSLVVRVARHPDVRTVDDLAGKSLGVQHGNTSEPVAQRLLAGAQNRIGADLRLSRHLWWRWTTWRRGGWMRSWKLEPVTRWLILDRPKNNDV